MKENWTEKTKQKLEGHRMAPPEGLWEDISRQMAAEAAPNDRPASRPATIRRWYWAAAVALVMAGLFAVYEYDKDERPLTAEAVGTPAAVTSPASPTAPMADETATVTETLVAAVPTGAVKMPAAPSKPSSSATPSKSSSAAPSVSAMADAQAPTSQVEMPADHSGIADSMAMAENTAIADNTAMAENTAIADSMAVAENTSPADKTEEQPAAAPLRPGGHPFLPEDAGDVLTADNEAYTGKWTVGLAGSNGLLAANGLTGTDGQSIYSDTYPEIGSNGQIYEGPDDMSEKTEDIEAKHHIPVRFGLSLRYQLNSRLALTSGVSYTALKSEFSIPQYPHAGYTQQLKYLGVPVGLSYRLWSAGRFNVYLSGAGMIEKCIGVENIAIGEKASRPWQWSLSAAAGAEYTIGRQFSVYIEPALSYYFDDGSPLEHYYNAHPLAPSLQFGLRLDLPR